MSTMTLLTEDQIEELIAAATALDEEADELAALARAKRVEASEMRIQIERHKNALDLAQRTRPDVAFRRFAQSVSTFGIDDVMEHLNTTRTRAQGLIDAAMEAGALARSKHGKKYIYAFLAPEADSSARPRHRTPESELAGRQTSGTAVAGSGRSRMSGRKDVDRLARAARKGGAEVTKAGNGHIKMVKDGEIVRMASTPRGSGMGKTKKELGELGIAV